MSKVHQPHILTIFAVTSPTPLDPPIIRHLLPAKLFLLVIFFTSVIDGWSSGFGRTKAITFPLKGKELNLILTLLNVSL